jgi:hypothetical protein
MSPPDLAVSGVGDAAVNVHQQRTVARPITHRNVAWLPKVTAFRQGLER